MVLLTPAIDVDKGAVTDHVNAGLWDRADPFGAFTVISPAELRSMAAARARYAAERFGTALQEARAHHDRRGLVPGSAGNEARWRAEAATQLRAVHDTHDELQRHSNQHRSPVTYSAVHTVESLLQRLTADYRRTNRRPSAQNADRFKEPA
ncbi:MULTISPECIES: hypothetical protein [unclassified Mycobacterium]|uniref:hypothetical protein n=1 Tax=unclassified Mycobacterium TaxID=2642494 RepID=UPI000801EB85|nr:MULTISPECIES: hypothetical protein [unclassified Mycobacterium]OBG71003.1 hypothetical protein A5700_13235 [Mycobacterium sp. E1214]OBH28976.1 hypothetical protein A5693_20400 [Mycobacterium sp. E1319]